MSEVLLETKDLRTWFEVRRGMFGSKGTVKAVD